MSIPSATLSLNAAVTADDVLEMQEYDRIVRFRDSILSGNHPSIKIPVPAGGKGASNQQAKVQSSASTTATSQKSQGGFASSNLHSFKANAQQPAVEVSNPTSSNVGSSKSLASIATHFDPLLLTKSEELIKAELHLRRQRLERALREEIDTQRAANKNLEQASDFDLSDILAKALTLVQATAPPLMYDMGANASVSSDSFDDNTFYSSQHDTPEPSPEPQAHNAADDVPMPDVATVQSRASRPDPTARPAPDQTLVPSPFLSRAQDPQALSASRKTGNATSASTASGAALEAALAHDLRYSPSYDVDTPTQLLQSGADESHAQVISSNGSGTTSRSGDPGNAVLERRADYNDLQAGRPRLPIHQFGHVEPLVRAHDLSPYAPQPSHVSQLVIARQQPVPEPEISILQGPPAQVAALRQEQGNGTSPESSPQGGKGIKKNNKKRKTAKRKTVGARAAERPGSPYIKPEPRSPSPLTSPQFVRPQKRQRPLNRSQHELNYDDSRSAQPVQVIHDDPLPISQRDRVPFDPYPRDVRYSVAPSGQRIERPLYEERRVEEPIQYVRRAQSPVYAPQYAASEARQMRSATYSIAEPIYREAPTYPREGRMSVRPIADRARSRSPVMVDNRPAVMAPPRPPTRIFRDEFGREYMEPLPLPPPVPRYSVAPPARPAEPEVIYEQAPVRAATRMPGPDTFERDGVLYRRASPVVAPRRVITQPEYGAAEYRDYRQRDYSLRPGATPTTQEFAQYRPESRPPQPEVLPGYGMRASTVRPAEQLRYEYPARVASVRPDVAIRDYAAGIHPEPRREAAIPVYREYSVRPAAEPELPRREYSVRPAERYYDNRPIIREDEVQFIDQPRTVQREVIYEDGRREVYR
ncbi:hypothetical protein BKA67DRAFT_652967 [Truncatella angustata]|uniref:Uncharacterized protein n=1 Tax=Truncatella angustata TaxID=152316 RepID=A0A9P9A3Y7_9PEZI|nr:uncharacterized protein BKA67DRAFT_652967 [Truncatella angustata]KAH6659750.1 hypothetical protein BKA67DRAFT_652967 [Truncatella angustata]